MYKILDFPEKESKNLFKKVLPAEYIENENIAVIAAVDEEHTVCGFLAFELSEDIIEIRYISVKEDKKRQKIGSLLVYEILERIENAVENDSKNYSLQVSYSDRPEYDELKAFFRGCGYFTEVESGIIYFVGPERRESERYKKLMDAEGFGYHLDEVTAYMKREFYNRLSEMNLDLISEEEEDSFERDLTYVSVKDEKITAGLFLTRPVHGEIIVEYAVALPGHHNAIGGLMSKAIKQLEERYPEENLTINALNEASEKLVGKLFGTDLAGFNVYTGIAFGAASQW